MAAAGAVILVGGFLLLTLTGHDTTAYVVFVSGPLVTTAVGALLAKQVGSVGATAQQAVDQTNGVISGPLGHLVAVTDANHQLLGGDLPPAQTAN